jgi:potassium-dependent mechanosensitive channel
MRGLTCGLRLRGLGRALGVLAFVCLTGQGVAQVVPAQPAPVVELAPKADASGNLVIASPAAPTETTPSLDYAAWGKIADEAEALIANPVSTGADVEALRARLVDWRAAFLGAQNANSTRIATLRTQIAALGPAPAEGESEAQEIANRRSELGDQLVRLQAPGIAADEAYQRADGLIREIDTLLRERQASELLQLWPMPINPANWPEAYRAAATTTVMLYNEFRLKWNSPEARKVLGDKLPVVLALLLLAIAILWRGRLWIDRLTYRLQNRATARGRRIVAFVASLGQIIIPVIGVVLFSVAMASSGMLGGLSLQINAALPLMGFAFFTAKWLGGRVFPAGLRADAPLSLESERRAEGRVLSSSFGILLALELLRKVIMDALGASQAAVAVISFPLLGICGLLLFRMGQFVQTSLAAEQKAEVPQGYSSSLMLILARASMALGVIGPLLAAVGYVSAASALIYPAVMSLGLVALLSILQNLINEIYALITGQDGEKAANELTPVLIGFLLTLATIPLFALIWGARLADLTELWGRFREGFQMGDTKISPTIFLIFAVVFGIGYALTRVFQGALKSSILPRTALDQGGQNAIVSGIGYLGIFLAALIAINAAGIDLSGLAIVAGALSVGIGFGLQNVVSNFVSGIILLIERPVSEGDWIEVGGIQGVVKSISVRATRIQTFDRSDVIVPNSDLISGTVTNYTRFNLSGRLIVPVGVAYGSDTRKVETILREIAEAQPMVVLTPPPAIVLIGFGADAVNFEMRMILRDVNFSVAVRSEVNHEIVRRFAEEGVEIPFTQQDIHLRNIDQLADALREFQKLGQLPAATAPKDKGSAET